MAKSKAQKKPYPGFPLTLHPSGRWCKKIRGKIHYFGRDAVEAEAKYHEQREDLQAGRQPLTTAGSSLQAIVNLFLDNARKRVDQGELSALSFRDYVDVGKQMVQHLGRTSDPTQIRPVQFTDFRNTVVKRYAPARAGKTITVTKMVFKWAYESELIEKLPRFGPDFKTATKRAARQSRVSRMISAEGIRDMLAKGDAQQRAMILLGVNGGLGNTDIAELRASDIDGTWLDYPRKKTGIARRIPLWPETVEAINAMRQGRDLLFETQRGTPMVTVGPNGERVDKITIRFRELLDKSGLYQKGVGFYALRHVFQTVADNARDPLATSAVMGHADSSMAGNYREHIADDRLLAVTNHVRDWLQPWIKPTDEKAEAETSAS